MIAEFEKNDERNYYFRNQPARNFKQGYMCGQWVAALLGTSIHRLPKRLSFQVTCKNTKKAGSKKLCFFRNSEASRCYVTWALLNEAVVGDGVWVNVELAELAGKVVGVEVNYVTPFRLEVWVRRVK